MPIVPVFSKLATRVFIISIALAATSAAIAQQPSGIRRLPTRSTAAAGTSSRTGETSSSFSSVDYVSPNFNETNKPALKFENAPSDILLQTYAEVTGKTLLIAPNVPKATITLRSQSELTTNEYLRAIETILVMNNIALVQDGEKFLRVFPAADLRKNGVKTNFDEPENGSHTEDGKMVSQMITLKNISIEEAKKVIEGFKRGEGQIQLFERTNSILVTDTVENVNRMTEILKFVDQPIINREETNVRPVKYAKAADIKKRLEEIINESQKEQQTKKDTVSTKNSGSPGFVRTQANVPGVLRPRIVSQNAGPAATENEIIETLIGDAERGVIRGKVQIVADERTNLLIFITRPENMKFFDKIIDVLDVEVQSVRDVIVDVSRLKYALSKDVAQMLNDLIGNNTKSSTEDRDAKGTVADRVDDGARSTTLDDAATKLRRQPPADNMAKVSDATKSKLGELKKEDVKILADERTNAIIIMASKNDVETIREIIKSMDIMLSQVVIETVIVSITSSDSLETGVDWVQRTILTGNGKNGSAPTMAFATAGGGGNNKAADATSFTTTDSLSGYGSGATFLATIFDLNLDLIIKAAAADSNAKVVSSPRIITLDNKEATIESTERIYWNEGTTYYSGSDNTSENIKSEDVGMKLTVTPRINNTGYITLNIKQEIQANDGYTTRNGKDFPNLSTRTMGADVAVQSGDTIVLGGLAQNSKSISHSKVPLLGSIPLLGRLFRYDKEVNSRTDIVMFLTPRVVDTPEQISDDARKIRATFDTDGVWRGDWSVSGLADPLSNTEKEKLLKRASSTAHSPEHPLTGALEPLNEIFGLTNTTSDVKE